MGTVHEAYDRVRGERVALKTFHGLDPWKLYCLKNEFRSLADVAHPNLVALYELVNDGQSWMLVMERVEGVTLDRWVRVGDPGEDINNASNEATEPCADTVPAYRARKASRPPGRGRADERRIRESFSQLVQGILALHRAGKLHRDLKPGNVLVQPDGHVTILDFGLVIDREDAREPDPARVAGTFEYLSPERIRGEPASEASDWYALGVMLYEALTGVLPYEGAGPSSALLRARGVEPKPPSELVAGIPDDLDTLCRALMRPDPVARPSGRDVLGRLCGLRSVEAATAAPPSVLLGRDMELDRLENTFRAVSAGELRVVRIVGPSGMGKTALLDTFTRNLSQRGDALVFKSRCLSAEASSYKGIDGLVDALSMYLAARPYEDVEQMLPEDIDALALMFPVLRRVRAVEYAMRPSRVEEPIRVRRRRAVEALGDILSALSREKPLVLCIDDLQWGDDDGAMLWFDLFAAKRLSRALFMAIARGPDTELPPSWRAIDAHARVETIALGPLSYASASALAGMLLRDADPALTSRVADVCGGHPILLLQLVEHVRETERRGVSDGQVDLTGLVSERLSRLPSAQREVVEVLSLVGRPLSLPALRAVCGDDVGSLARPLGLGRWVRTLGSGADAKLEMFHDRLREHVVEHLQGEAKRLLHGRIARGLAGQEDQNPELLSHHFALAGAPERARHEAERAGDEALATFAFERASRMYERALTLLAEVEAEAALDHRRRLLLGLASSLEGLGRGQDAAARWAEVAALTHDPEDALDLRRRAAEQWLVSGHVERGLSLLDEVAKAVNMSVPKTRSRAIAELVLYRAMAAPKLRGLKGLKALKRGTKQSRLRADASFALSRALSLLDTAYAYALQARALYHALDSGEPQRIAHGLAWEASLRGGLHGPEDLGFLSLMRQAEEAASELGSTQAMAFCGLARGCTLVLAGQYRAGIDHLERADQLFAREPSSITWELTLTRVFRAAAMAWGGDYRGLTQHLERSLGDAEARGDGYASTVLRLLAANGVRYALRDDPAGLLAEVNAQLAHWPNHPMAAQVPRRYGDWLRAFAHLLQGDALAAKAMFASVRAQASMLDYTPPALSVELDYLEGLILLAQPGDVPYREVRKLERKLAAAERRFGPALSGMLAAARALRADREVLPALSRAQAACESADMRGLSAVVRWARGMAEPSPAGRHLREEAVAWLEAQGALAPERFARLWIMPWTLAQHTSR